MYKREIMLGSLAFCVRVCVRACVRLFVLPSCCPSPVQVVGLADLRSTTQKDHRLGSVVKALTINMAK